MNYSQQFLEERKNEKFRIVIKRDFGKYAFWIGGKFVKSGFVVTKGGCNVMPGATWFQTIEEAMNAIPKLIQSEGDSNKFWELMRAPA